MPTVTLTDPGVKAIKATASRVDYFDDVQPGLVLRVNPTGHKAWCVLYRMGGDHASKKLQRKTLGSYPKLKLAAARELARTDVRKVAGGQDVAATKRESRAAETFGDLAPWYVEDYAKARKRSWKEDERRIRTILLPAWRTVKLRELKRADVRAVVEDKAKTAPVEANRLLALIRKMLNFAVGKDLIEANPATKMDLATDERSRDRVLTNDEIRALWAALDSLEHTVRDAFRLRLLTAQRGGEVARMRWADLDLEARWWTIPATDTKNGLAHRVPLAQPAVDIIKARRELAAAISHTRKDEKRKPPVYVFPSSRRGAPAVELLRHACAEVATAAKLRDFRGHDLRRTAATKMGEAGISRFVIGRVLNHIEPGVTAIYDRATYDSEKRTAIETWQRTLTGILANKKPARNVAAFRGR